MKGAFFGSIAWELIYGVGQRLKLFAVKPHLTKTHYAMLFNHIIYGAAVAKALVVFSEPSAFPDKSETTAQNTYRYANQPIYPETNYNSENSDAYEDHKLVLYRLKGKLQL